MIVEDVGFAFYFTYPPLYEVIFFNIECPLRAEKGLLTLKSEYPVSGSGFQIIIKFKGRTGLILR
jgi:hypothetical protein